MGIKVTEHSTVLQVFENVEGVLYLTSVLILSLVLICFLLLVVAPIALIVQNNACALRKIRNLNIIVFKITKYIFRFLKVDRSMDVPRFVMFGYRAPVYYTYHLLVVSVMIAAYCLRQFWNITFLSAKVPTTCDDTLNVSNDTQCFLLNIKSIQAVTSLISLVAAIVFVYAFLLEILLKFSKGKESCHNLCDKTRKSCLRLLRVIVTLLTQVFTVFVIKGIYIAYFIATDYGQDTSNALFDKSSWFVWSLLVDVLCFVMLTPWFFFEKITEQNADLSSKESDVQSELTATAV